MEKSSAAVFRLSPMRSGILGPARYLMLSAAVLSLPHLLLPDIPGLDMTAAAQVDPGDDDLDDEDNDEDDEDAFDGDDFADDDVGDDEEGDDDFNGDDIGGDEESDEGFEGDDIGGDDFGDDDASDDDLDEGEAGDDGAAGDDDGDDQVGAGAGGDDNDEDDDDDDDRNGFDDDDDEDGDEIEEDERMFEAVTGIDPDDFDFDDDGFPARTNEILAFDLGTDDLAIARDLGFVQIERRELASLGGSIVRLRVPKEFSLPRAVDALEGALPASPFDYNHIFIMPEGRADTEAGPITPIGQPRSGSGIRLGIIDTLVDQSHPSLRGQSITVRDFAQSGGRDTTHATAVVSILAGSDTGADYSGLVPGATIYAANVFTIGDTGLPATDSLAMITALDWLSGQDVGVISISIAGPDSAVVSEAVSRVQARGQVVVAAVGNDGPAAPPLYPASYDGVVGVTAIDLDRRVYRRAGRGTHVDFSAPGVRVRVANAAGGYATMSGTSFATPIVSALVALRIAKRMPEAGSELARLTRSVVDLGDPGKDDVYGNGMLVIEGER